VHRDRFLTKLERNTLIVAVVAGATLCIGGTSHAAAPASVLGSLTLDPATGSDQATPNVTTSGGCPAPADRYQVLVNGPNLTNYAIRAVAADGFSANSPISTSFGVSMKDAASDQGAWPITAGQYDVTFQCLHGLQATVVGTYTTAMIFTSATEYHTSTPGTTTTTSAPATSTAPSTTTSATAPSTTTSDSPTSVNTTSPSTATTSDFAAPTTTSEPDNGTSVGVPGSLANTGAQIGLLFVGGLILLAAGLALVLWRQRRKKDLLEGGVHAADRLAKPISTDEGSSVVHAEPGDNEL
jgi:LPXTG-motif cell wall-anchored protein